MTSWWQRLFSETIDTYFVQLELSKLEIQILKVSSGKPELLQTLLDEKQIRVVSSCTLKPCVRINESEVEFYEITPEYLATLNLLKKRKTNMIYWETSFLMVFILLSIAYLSWALYREKTAQREKKEFLAMTTHELKHPVAVVSLVLDSLKRDSLPPERREEFLDKGLAELRDLKTSLENLLKIQEFEFEENLKTEPYGLQSQLNQIIQYWQIHELNKLNRIEYAKTNVNYQITAHPKLLEIIMNNLIENALLYSKDKVSVRIGKDGKHPFVEVQDLGLGFSPEEKKNFQKMFYRSGRYEVQNQKGTGLGHYIIKKLSNNSGISIFLDSAGENMGSKFKVYIK
ncbi:MAG: HAMP domain-containing sensor histidine kinase [Leptospirales bacterium]